MQSDLQSHHAESLPVQSHTQSLSPVSQSINQFTFPVFGTRQGSQQTIAGKVLRILILNETSHSMLFWATKSFSSKLHIH